MDTKEKIFTKIIFIVFLAVFMLYQLNYFTVKVDSFSMLTLSVPLFLLLLPYVEELEIPGFLKIKKDKIFSEKEGKEIQEKLAQKADKAPQEIKEKIRKEERKEDTELAKLLYDFLLSNKELQENLNIISPADLKNVRFENKSILEQSKKLYNRNIINKELYLAIQYLCQKRNLIIHGQRLSKKELKESLKISEDIRTILWEMIEDDIDSYLSRDTYDEEFNR